MNTYEQVVMRFGEQFYSELSAWNGQSDIRAFEDLANMLVSSIEVNGKTYRLALVEDEAGLPINPYQVEANRKWQAMEPNGYDTAKVNAFSRGVTDMLRAGFVKELKEGE